MNTTNKESQESKRKSYVPKSILSFWFLWSKPSSRSAK